MTRLRRTLAGLSADRRGAAAVEAAFVLPLLLLLLLGVIEFGRMAWARSSLDFAVQEAARCAVVRTDVCGTPAATAQYAANRLATFKVPAQAFTVTPGLPCGVRVRARYEYRLVTVAMVAEAFGGAPTLTAEVCRA
jgi:Flp pilus assembly protein TadG